MWGINPSAGAGTRIQPLAFSKELLPVGSRVDAGTERPRAVAEYLVERMLNAGVDKLCFVISPGKSDILQYFGGAIGPATICYVVQNRPGGLCDALFSARALIADDESVTIGLPDTIWFPEDALARTPDRILSLLLFPVEHPEYFDAVVTEPDGTVREVRVKRPDPGTRWVWGAMRMPGIVFRQLHELWTRRGRSDEYMGTLINAFLAAGGRAAGVPLGSAYVDVGTFNGYREALRLLLARSAAGDEPVVEMPHDDGVPLDTPSSWSPATQ